MSTKTMVSAIALITLAGCAGRTPNPVAVAQIHDSTLSCQAIQAEVAANNHQISELGKEQGAKTAQNVAAGVAGLFIWPLFFAMDFQGSATKEIAALEQRNSYLGQMALSECAEPATFSARTTSITPARYAYQHPAAPASTPAHELKPARDLLTGQPLSIEVLP
jgi:hypothetical protein